MNDDARNHEREDFSAVYIIVECEGTYTGCYMCVFRATVRLHSGREQKPFVTPYRTIL
jgi:hypothetical protein